MSRKKSNSKAPPNGKSESPAEPEAEFVTQLTKGSQRFLVHVMENAFTCGRRSPGDFVRHFTPSDIMAGLEHQALLRADILEDATGVRRKIALKKSHTSSAEDLQIALDEGETTAEQIVSLFKPDDRVRYLSPKKLWNFLVEGAFWKVDRSSKQKFEQAKEHIAFIIDRALADKMITHGDLVDGVSIDSLAESLPRSVLAKIIKAALALGKDKTGFTDADLLDVAAARILVEDVALEHLWTSVVVPKIAQAHGFTDEEEPAVIVSNKPKTVSEERGSAVPEVIALTQADAKRGPRDSAWDVDGTADDAVIEEIEFDDDFDDQPVTSANSNPLAPTDRA